jgi:hypothetical protein
LVPGPTILAIHESTVFHCGTFQRIKKTSETLGLAPNGTQLNELLYGASLDHDPV